MRKLLTTAVLCVSFIFSSVSAYAGHGYYGHHRGHHGHYDNYLYPLGIFAGGVLIGSYLSRPRYPAYPPPAYYAPAYDYEYVYPPPAHAPAPRVIYPPPKVYYAQPTITYVQPVVPTPQVTATPTAPNCLSVREYQSEIVIGNKTVEAYGFACLKPDGSWQRGAPVPVP